MILESMKVLFDAPGPMSGMSSFQDSYFYGGLWLIFLILALGGLAFVIYDSQKKQVAAPGWKIGVVVMVLLVLPTMLFRFSVTPDEVDRYYELQNEIWDAEHYQEGNWVQVVDDAEDEIRSLPMMTGNMELILYLGVLGGIGGVGLAVAYYMMYKDSIGNQGGFDPMPIPPQPIPPQPIPSPGPSRGYTYDERPSKKKANAWLVGSRNRNYQLYQGQTTIGRSAKNDIQIEDTTISKSHAKIVEQNGHFKFHDLGSTNGSRINGRLVRQPVLLQTDDEIQLGDHTKLRFVSGRG